MTAREPNPNLALVSTNRAGQNRLLSLLPMDERQRLLSRCKRTPFESGDVLYPEKGDITDVYFPLSGIVSLVLSEKETAGSVEIAMIGNEGVVGIPIFLGAAKSPTKALWQAAGEALRMPATHFANELDGSAT